ncbi:magnesium and cobalt transport protein CorA [Streptomyces europaeiscabiei]|uniref:magnesium and cobalt transport protein CorA n=1 Tax=Streptomyces europaeiscabiei TaxID=146819 RepID=UPI002E19EAB6
MADRRARPAAKSAGPASKGGRKSGWRRALPPPSTPPAEPTAPNPDPAATTAERAASVVEAALYQDGVRVSSPATLADTFRELREAPAGMAWIGLARPTEAELLSLAAEFDLHPLAVEDAMEAHQRPKLERYGDTLFVVLRAARYLDASEEVDFAELHVFVGPDFVITVRHGAAPDLSAVRRRMEETPELLKLGPEAVLYAILDAVVDGYVPVVAGVQNDVDEIETEVFRGDPEVSRRIYELSREMVEFQRATRPLVGMLHGLMAGFAKYETDDELQRYLRDVADHVTHTSERVDGYRQALTDILTVNATLVTQQQNAEMRALAEAGFEQNEEIKKISSWAAILFAPTLVGTVYGMNFEHMPELHWVLGYPLSIALMAAVCTSLYIIFKRRDWL